MSGVQEPLSLDVWASRRIVEILVRQENPHLLLVHEGGEVSVLHWDPLFRVRSWASRGSYRGFRGYPKSTFAPRGLLTHDDWELWLWREEEGALLARHRPGAHVHAVAAIAEHATVVASQSDGVTTLLDSDLKEVARHVGPDEGGWAVTAVPGLVVVGRDRHVELLAAENLQEVAILPLPSGRLVTVEAFDGNVIVEEMGGHLYTAHASGLRAWQKGSWIGTSDGLMWIVRAGSGLLAFASCDASGPRGCVPEIMPEARPRAVFSAAGGSTIVVGHKTVWIVDRRSWTAETFWESDEEILAEAMVGRDSLLLSVEGRLLRLSIPALVCAPTST